MNKLCECGCGKDCKYQSSHFLPGHASRTKETKEKMKQSMLYNYGVEYPYQSKEIQNKHKQTCLDHYGVDNPSKVESVQEKKIQTCLDHYGVDNPSKVESVQEKMKQTFLKRFGVTHQSKSEFIKEKKRQTNLNHWGVDNFAKTIKGREISRKNYIRMVENQKLNGEHLTPRIGDQERLFLDEIQLYTKYNISKQDSVIGYFPDGHIPELNLFIQFDERHHFLDKNYKIYKQDDIDCTMRLASLGYIIYRISLKQWKENKEKVIEQFQLLIQELSKETIKC